MSEQRTIEERVCAHGQPVWMRCESCEASGGWVEPRTSNSLASQARTVANSSVDERGVALAVITNPDLMRKLADEIERLTAELASVTDERDSLMDDQSDAAVRINELLAERDRLTDERDEFEANLTIAERQVTEAQAERDRLRALVTRALAAFRHVGVVEGIEQWCKEAEALAGAADETSEPPYKCNLGEGCPNPTPVPHWHE